VVARLDAPSDEVRSLQRSLCSAETARARRFVLERHRRRFIVARGRLRRELGARLGVAPEAVEISYSTNGKPYLAHDALQFSVSHCDDVALYAFSSDAIGVDIEAIRPPREREDSFAFLYIWTRKEALAKALGDALTLPLEELDVVQPPKGWRLRSFFPLPGFIAAVACRHG
jgi:4'-phosphopantetheinyl transferase